MSKDSKILILPDYVANQIAAGEVVQRPESVVKELVENAIDAGADTVFLTVKGSGKSLIHVLDNGTGMSKEDLLLSIKRHATSKIISAEDLEKINTFGFRGEALASICSVASVEIRTKQAHDDIGYKLIAEPNQEPIIEAFNSENGTQIFVKNLFYNVPARKKFLKSNITEFRYIAETFVKIAISHPEIRFIFYDDDSLVFDAKPTSLEERIYQILGEQLKGNIFPISFQDNYIKISGYIGNPLVAKQSKSGQYLYLNGRHIQSKSLTYSIYNNFEHLLEKNLHPMFVVNLEIDPRNFDVNVHPQKHEVKFEDEKYIFNAIRQAVAEALRTNNLTPEIHLDSLVMQSPFSVNQANSTQVLVDTFTGEIIDSRPPQNNFPNSNYGGTGNYNSGGNFRSNFQDQAPKPQFNVSAFDLLFNNDAKTSIDFDSKEHYWQMHNKYILKQTEKGLLIIDMHNAHERINYEKAFAAINKEFNDSQQLLFPAKFEVTISELSLINDIETELRNLGYDFTIEGKKIELNAIPADLNFGEEEKTFREIIEKYEEYQGIRVSDKRDNLAASYSCKASVKTGEKLNYDEMKELVNRLLKCKVPYVCPHGRPVILEYNLEQFDKQFGRTS